MRYFIFVSIILSLYFSSFAQVEIPGVLNQPEWFIPIYFEDEARSKDTIYIGYDTDADFFSASIDSNYENFQELDTSEFHAILWRGFEAPLDNTQTSQQSITSNYNSLKTDVTFINGQGNLKMTWDNIKLDNANLPSERFPFNANKPRAKIDLGASYFNIHLYNDPEYMELDFHGWTTDHAPFYLTDYVFDTIQEVYLFNNATASDSVIIEGDGGLISNIVLNLRITPHNLLTIDVLDELHQEIVAYPNPFTDFLSLQNFESLDINKFELLNVLNEIVLQGDAKSKIVTENLSSGFYILNLKSKTRNYKLNLIKN